MSVFDLGAHRRLNSAVLLTSHPHFLFWCLSLLWQLMVIFFSLNWAIWSYYKGSYSRCCHITPTWVHLYMFMSSTVLMAIKENIAQCRKHSNKKQRWLYNWANRFSSSMDRSLIKSTDLRCVGAAHFPLFTPVKTATRPSATACQALKHLFEPSHVTRAWRKRSNLLYKLKPGH